MRGQVEANSLATTLQFKWLQSHAELMVTVAIQKEYTTDITQSKVKISLSVFLKGKNSITSLMTEIAMFDWLFLLFARGKSHRTKAKASKNGVQWKSFLL